MRMSKELRVAIQAAKAAGAIIKRHYQKKIRIKIKPDKSQVTNVDYACDKAIISIIRKAFPEHAILTEESGLLCGTKNSPYTWVVDPLDGTRGFIHGDLAPGPIIGLAKNNKPIIGVVFLPMLHELFYAEKGKGAYCNGKRIHVRQKPIRDIIVGMNKGPKYNRKSYQFMLDTCDQFKFRISSGPDTIVNVAWGRFDASICFGLNAWDIAGCAAIVHEAGGKVTTFDNKLWTIKDKDVVLASPGVHQKLLEHLRMV